MSAAVFPRLVAIVFRKGRGCRQYPFFSAEVAEKWAKHPAYAGDTLRVMHIAGGRFVADHECSAGELADAIRLWQRVAS